MRNLFLSIGLPCLLCLFFTTTAGSHFIQVDQYSVVFDDRNNLYWVQTAPRPSGIYENQLAIVDSLNTTDNLKRISGQDVLWKTWRIATQEDMVKLWTYEPEEIANAFEGAYSEGVNTPPYYLFGRYDEGPTPGQHYVAGILADDNGNLELSTLPAMSVGDTESLPWLGSWIVADEAPVPLPASRALPSLMLLLN